MGAPSLNDLPAPPSGKTGWPWTEESSPVAQEQPVSSPFPRISVVTPSYNQGPFLEETIRSVLLQGYPNLEYIVIDGGSTDGSVEIIRKYEPWITYWISEPDNGQTNAINKGFSRAAGDVLSWLNSDDVYCPGVLGLVGSYVAASPHVDLLYGDCEMIDGRGRVYDSFNVRSGEICQLLQDNFIAQPSAFWTRQAWEKVGGLDERLHYVMDYDLWLRMFLSGITTVYFPFLLSRFRYHSASKSTVGTVRFGLEYLDVLDKISAEPRERKLMQSILQGYYQTFEAIIAVYEKTIGDDKEVRDSLLILLDRWVARLKRFRSGKDSSRRLLAQSYFLIGIHFCLLGEMNTARHFLAKTVFRAWSLFRETLPWWFRTFSDREHFNSYRRLFRMFRKFPK